MWRSGLEWTLSRPRFVFVACVAVGVLAWFGLSRLGFDPSYSALLPTDSPALQEFEAVKRDLGGGTSDLVVIVSGPASVRDALARDIVAFLADDPRIARADAEIPRAFFEERALYLIERADLDELARRVDAAYRASIARAMAVVDVDDADDDERADPWAAVLALGDAFKERYGSWQPRQISSDGARRYVFIRPRVAAFQIAAARTIVADIRAAIQERADALDAHRHGVEVQLAGWLMIHLAEQQSTAEDLRRATGLALALVVLMLTVATRRLAASIVVAVPLVLALVITLALASALLGELNLLSAFTLPALVGLGIDFGIHLYVRFLAELNIGAHSGGRHAAMRRAIHATIGGSATSAITTAAAFFSLALVDFRGFREFGMLGGTGVLVTLMTTYAVLPPLAVRLTRHTGERRSVPSERSASTDREICARVAHRSRILASAVLVLALVGAVASAIHLPGLTFENDFRDLRGTSEVIALTESLEDDLGFLLNPTVFVVPDLDAARTLEERARALQAERDASGSAHAIGIARVGSAARMIPADADERFAIMARTAQLLEKTLAFGEAAIRDPEQRRGLERLIELTRAQPFAVDDLPASVRRRLVTAESDALIVFVWPDDRLYHDAIMVRWLALIDTLRERLASALSPERAARVRVLDERRVPLDVVAQIRRDLPRALAFACLLVGLALFVHFRRVTVVLTVAGSMALAMVFFLGLLAATGVHLDMYNTVVLPCIVGIGIDNAIHIRHAYERARANRAGAMRHVLATTGLAALLSSLTTGIGFGVAMIARQGGLQSMGLTAVLGMACTLLATTAVLPAAIHLLDRQRVPTREADALARESTHAAWGGSSASASSRSCSGSTQSS